MFIHANAISDPLPATDAVMIREMLFHLSYNDIYTALRNVLSTDCKWLLLTTDQVDTLNVDIKTGDFRILNLETKPFFFPKPKFVLQENSNRRDRILGVWNTDDLRSYLQ
jgi:hypothetical protein